jgi:hypothetical protein
MPNTIQHAIIVTKALGFSYLWVDALCIIQDSPSDLEKELAVMGLIYSKSSLTIAAGVGWDADAGLASQRVAFETKPTIVNIKFDAEGCTFEKQVAILEFRRRHPSKCAIAAG